MEPFTTLTGIAAPMDEANVDTNQLCPTRFNKRARGAEFARIVFHDRRFNADGSAKPDFVLNRAPYDRARVLVAGRNFGCGSSRETAVWGLLTFGIRAVIAPSFGDIFVANSYKNSLLPIVLPADTTRTLLDHLLAHVGAELTVDLPKQQVRLPDGTSAEFAVHPLIKRRLVGGLDEITLTKQYEPAIAGFEKRYLGEYPWIE
jgi:3-isopropylmalate/(R)-2-methylmalate dehydratase small subunit